MKPWDQRPIEYRNLFNPAFCGLVLNRAFQGYEELNDDGMPFSLSLLVLPLCLHAETRNVIGVNSRARLLKTVEGNQQILVGFAVRAKNLLPYTLEALGLLTHLECIEVDISGRLKTEPKSVRAKVSGTPETVECQRVARVVGKEFARIADRVTIFATIGVRP